MSSATREAILARLIEAARPVSGAELAAGLGISRTAVWKHIHALQRAGVAIAAIRGRGYRLESDPLCAAAVTARLATRRLGRLCVVLDETDSTNAEAMRRAEAGAPEGLALLAERQLRGRGRLGRRWHAWPEHSLAMSVLLRPRAAPEAMAQLPLVAAVAAHDALAPLAPGLGIKWPNDLLLPAPDGRGRKLAGILTEMRAEPGRVQAVVVGFGINVRAPAGGWPAEIAPIAAALGDAGDDAGGDAAAEAGATPPSRNAVAARVLNALERRYDEWREQGFAPIRRAWLSAHVATGRRARAHDGSRYIEGVAEGLDADGALLLRVDGELARITAGDLELTEGGDAP